MIAVFHEMFVAKKGKCLPWGLTYSSAQQRVQQKSFY
jgi:hypothetical protein